ncbi:MAG: putative Phosphatidylinositol N-acetylglucosaminyltransferase [Nitrospira sp.]|nr:MAG: putative Phosphatidylinositol N-acetylglucosaminyltransferase [Nitrospira sp.]
MIAPQFSPLVGGYERAAERLSTELGQKGHDVTVVSERRESSWQKIQTMNGFTVRRLWCIYRPGWHTVTSLLSLSFFLLLHRNRFDVFHLHQYGYHAAVTVALGKLLRRPVVLKITSTEAQGILQTLVGTHKTGGLLASLHRKVSGCIATSEAVGEEAARFGVPKERIVLVPNGLNTTFFSESTVAKKTQIKTKLALNKSLTVLFSGRLSAEKNPDGLLEAWAEICCNPIDAELVFIGDGPMRQALANRIESLGIGSSVRLAGNQREVVEWYQASDIFVLPSHREGLSNSLLEAMSCGLPVVSTRVSGSIDIFEMGDIGELVECGSVRSLAGAVHRLLIDPIRRATCGTYARQLAEARFSIHTVATETVALYESLLAHRLPALRLSHIDTQGSHLP